MITTGELFNSHCVLYSLLDAIIPCDYSFRIITILLFISVNILSKLNKETQMKVFTHDLNEHLIL